jgi:hypothetical protein
MAAFFVGAGIAEQEASYKLRDCHFESVAITFHGA